jgi:hypothetical protein
MATKNWIRLAASPQWSDGTDGVFSTVDLSAYVDPLRNKGFRITDAKVQVMMDDSVNGLMNDSATTAKSIAMQIATGTQTATLRPSDGKVVYHNFANYINDADGGPYKWTQYEWNVSDLWPDGFYAVVDTLTVGVISTADFTSTLRVTYTLAGYQVSISAQQLASFLVAQTQN